ncbi:HEAT repeat domain-containing protein [Natronobacterium gregoryi]|uniref:Adaptin n=2 Tax=Natronobacterium gregoryi TaxID=44930 RepID=L0AL78_NATGS|nr:HEAT repeat domain-containing protein [Natronobacterium gregoryi]AFZ73805.1 Armadillo/beta-catenin-like repeat protein [Natronobacterium gregoryi SP2]ELY65292.1 adaptin protein [Natronobacterium gregoryi SP2]PLK19226.1 adaptin [Natronobacterium gregoryi SP2]SFJ56840.1 Armadillo/beta-catenin-like repeat-containing protein [Natronobacterium gregoryi]
MYVLAFDRDWTVDVNPHPSREAVPIEWVRYWAYETEHEVWAIGNQDLVDEADIPGTVESIRRRDGDIDALGDRNEFGNYEWWPEREARLRILAELFPDADEYVVVDDLDLSHVDGWDHYHAWDFVELVRDGKIELSIPSSDDLVPDGGFESADEVRDILADGYVFEFTYRTEEETKTHLVTHFEPERPSMKPLKGPPAFWFETVGNEEKFSVRLPDIESVHPVPYERLADPFLGAAFAAVRSQLEEDAETVDGETLREMLSDSVSNPARVEQREALRLAMSTLQHREAERELAIEAVFEVIADEPSTLDRKALRTVWESTKDEPAVLEEYVPELASYASQESPCQPAATRCLMEIAEANPGSVLEAVPAVETAVTSGSGMTQSYAVYTFSSVAEEYPEEVFPAVPALITALQSDDDTTQTNALAALGKIASNYPDAAEPIVDELVVLLDAEAKSVRNNAVGLLGDLAQEHPDIVIEHADRIAARLEDNNVQARVNASLALLQAGEADPSAIRAQQDQLESALEDPSPEVRANACSLIGNANVPVPIEELKELEANDMNDTVRERAAWTITRVN